LYMYRSEDNMEAKRGSFPAPSEAGAEVRRQQRGFGAAVFVRSSVSH